MKFKQIQEMDDTQIEKKLFDLKKELIKLNGSVATGTAPKNSGQVKVAKKDIAKLLTAKKQREVKLNGR